MGLGGGGLWATILGLRWGVGGGTAVDITPSSKASRATWYGVRETWGVGRGLAVSSGGDGFRMDGWQRGVVSVPGAGARPIRLDTSHHLSPTATMGVGPRAARAPAHFAIHGPRPGKDGLEGMEEATLMAHTGGHRSVSLCRRTVEDRLPLERMPFACTLGSPLNLHVRQSLGLRGPVDLDHHRVEFSAVHQQWLSTIVHNFTVHPGAAWLVQSEPDLLIAGRGHSGQLGIDRSQPFVRYGV